MKKISSFLKDLSRYPSAMVGTLIIIVLLMICLYVPFKLPYSKAITLWRGSEADWYHNPKLAYPEWTNFFRKEKLASSFHMSTADGTVPKDVTENKGVTTTTMLFNFDYNADVFPTEVILYFKTNYNEKQPFLHVYWYTPDGREIRIGDFSVGSSQSLWFSQISDTKFKRRIGGLTATEGLFVDDPKAETRSLLKGPYQVKVVADAFEPNTTVDVELVLHGQVAGWAGTDHLRRDISIALLWGAPVALAFGLVTALFLTMAHMAIAAAGVWFGGWVDETIQRVTEINLVLPFLPILIMVGTFYNRNIVTIFTTVVLLSLFGASIKGLRATFLQIKEASYIEAARSYGAGSWRIIFTYLMPRLIPLLIPALVTAIPFYVFLEASLAVLGLGDPSLPTWGKLIYDAEVNGALYKGLYYWILEPAVLLMATGTAFALVGFALDRIFNPRLRGI
jgi:peptide/nickel transport system permease protein